MKLNHLLMAGAAAMSLSACMAMDGTGDGMAGAASAEAMDMTPEQATPYLAMSASSDLFEIQSSQMHHQQGQSPPLHQFASTMIEHHTRLSAQTIAAARAAGLTPPPPALLPMHQEMLDRLRPLRGAAFDREYKRLQTTSHEMALRLQQNYAQSGDTPQLRTNAAAAVPIVQGHLDQVRSIRI